MIRRLVPLALVLALLGAFGIQGALAAPAGPPTGVTGLAQSGAAQIAWQPVSGADSYVVLRGTSSTNITTTVTPAGGVTGTSFTNTGLTNSTTYYYVVRAVGGSVTTANSTITQVTPRASTCSGGNVIVTENCFPGTTGWKVTNADVPGSGGIEGYATASSINRGESVDLKVNAAAGSSYRVEIYRTGSYGGAQGRLVSTIPNLTAVAQPDCVSQSNTGLLDCSNWSSSATLTTTSSWQAGVYLIRLVRSTGTDFHVLLTVRNDSAVSDVVYVVPDATYQAYNSYGGKSLYSWSSSGANTLAGADRAVKVSFDRPYEQVRTNQFDWYTTNDLRMVSWLESQGYDVGYITNTDLERDPSLLNGRPAVMMGAHDEYYSTGMRNALTDARNAGTSVFVAGANSMYWQIRYESSPVSSASRRVVVSYKTVESGPADPQGPTSTWRDPNGANQPENGFAGIMYLGDSDFNWYPLRVSAAEGQDPVWRHTDVAGLAPGTFQNIGSGLVGWEWDGRVDNGSEPAGLRVLASTPVTGNLSQGNGASVSPGSTVVNVTKYTASSGALVFATGTNNWNRGLDFNQQGDGEPNLNIQQATTNVLSDMGVVPASPSSDIVLDGDSPPRVLITSPGNAATGIAVDISPVAAFSREMNPSTINSTTVSLRTQAGAAVASTITYNAATRRVTIDPNANLALQTTYIARVTTGAKATDGTSLEQQTEWTFTTADPPPPPTVTATFPATNATGINPAAAVTATFSRAMDAATITSSSFRLAGPGNTTVPATVSYDAVAQRATLTPTSSLALNTAYTATVTTAVTSADGIALAAPVTFGFSTWASPPPPPTVIQTTPSDGGTGVEVASPISAAFSRDMDASSITAQSATLSGPGGQSVPATVSYEASTRRAIITPTAPLAVSTAYTATFSAAIRAADGIALGTPVTVGFTTSASPCPCQLFANSVVPDLAANPVQDGRGGAGPFTYEMGVKVTATTSAEIRAIRFYKSLGENGTHVGRVWTSGGTQRTSVTFTNETASGWQTQQLVTPLAITAGQTYVISVNRNTYYPLTTGGLANQITSGPIQSVVGSNGVYGNSSGVFPTNSWNNSNYFVDLVVGGDDAPPPTTPPTVVQTTPAAGATDVTSNVSPVATFSRAMDPATFTTSSVTLRPQGGQPVTATVSYDAGTNEVTVNPAFDLNASTVYQAQITTAVKSANGIALAAPVTWSFTTEAGPAPGALVQLFPDTTLPQSPANSVQDGRSGAGPFTYELGVKVTANAAAEIRALRFYKSPGETGTHVGRIWSSGGTQLAQVTFANETASGWQTQQLAAPLAITSGQTYVLSVNANAFYPVTAGGLASQITAGPVRTVVGSNGVYGNSAGAFPTASWNNSNYMVDLQVAATDIAPDLPPTVSGTTPANNATNVPTDVSPTATFSRAMDGTTLTTATATVRPEGGSPVPATVTYDSSNNRVTIDPDADLTPSLDYQAQITVGAKASNGVALAAPVTWSFTTSAAPAGSASQLYPDTTVPDAEANPVADGRTGTGPYSYETGVKVQATLGAEIQALRFWKSPGETGTHIGRVWSETGTPLAQVTFAGETASGWQTEQLSTPLALVAGRTYVISVNRNDFYPVTPGGLATQRTAGPVRTVVGSNGVYADAAGTFPTTSWNNSSYLVDLVVIPTEVAPPPGAPTATTTTPADDATAVPVGVSPTAAFSRAMDPATLDGTTVTIRPDGGSPLTATVSYDANTDLLTIDPAADLSPATDYTADVSTAAKSADGAALDGPVTWSFTTESAVTTSQLFPNTATPATDANAVADGRTGEGPFTYEMGVKVTATAAAEIRAVRFYKSPGETGTHVGRVWTSGGTPLAQVTFTGEGSSGWQTAQLGNPVAVTAGDTYVVSVNRNDFYPLTTGGLASQLVAGPVQTVVGGNGVFADAAGAFPTASYADSDYLVDLVVAEPTPTAPAPVPTVVSTTPADGATGIAPNASPTATFSRGMNAATLNGTSVTLRPAGGSPVDATVSYNATTRRVTINPDADLDPSTAYTAQISTTATSSAGAALAAPVGWSFTTAAPPTVTATTPEDGATGVAVSISPTATFSRAMNVSTLTGGAATVRPQGGGSAVAASITYDSVNNRVVINPSADLATGTTYVAQISTAAKAADGAALGQAFSWTFTTIPAPTVTAATPADGTTGVALGVSPTATFSRAMTVGSLSTTTATLRPAGGSPVAAAVTYSAANLTVTINPDADLIPGTTYTATISTGASATDGAPLASAYSWSFTTVPPPTVTATTPADNATGVALNVSPTATFSRAMNAATLTTASATVTPQGGSAVAAVVSYDAANRRVTINPTANLTPGTVYTGRISTAATDSNGVPMTSAATWTFTTQPPPTVTATTPEAGATGVAVNVSPTATFSRAMTSSSFTTSTANVRPQSGGGAVSASVSYDAANNRVTINPSSNLALGTAYVATITTGVTASDGIALASNFTWTFTTITAPTVTATTPAANATGVGINDDVTATFSRAMNPSTLTTSTVILRRQGSSTNLTATVAYDSANNRVTLNPSAALLAGTGYTAFISTGATSADGVALTSTVSWNFTTIPAPTVTATTPAANTSGVAVDTSLTATFSRAMNPATLTTASATVRVQGSGSALAATVSYDAANNRVTIDPTANLLAGTVYQGQISTAATGADGIPLASTFSWSFTTPTQLFADTLTPATPASAATLVRETGVRITMTDNAQARAIRFWKSPGETGTHTGRIWNSNGTQLGNVVFSGETASGWQTAQLTTPVTLSDNQTYTISVNRNNFYPSTSGGLNSQVIAGPMRTVVGSNGVYGLTSGSRPQLSSGNTNFFVDLIASQTL